MKKIRKLINNISCVCLIIILISVCYSKFISKDEMITLFGKGFLVIITESMYPTIESGELIIISEKKSYKEGDIITYLDQENMIVTHRINEINDKTFIAKGDNNNIEDDECGIDRIYGKVIYQSKLLGIFVLYFLKPCLIIYVFYLIISEIFFALKKAKQEESNRSLEIDCEKSVELDVENKEECECKENMEL